MDECPERFLVKLERELFEKAESNESFRFEYDRLLVVAGQLASWCNLEQQLIIKQLIELSKTARKSTTNILEQDKNLDFIANRIREFTQLVDTNRKALFRIISLATCSSLEANQHLARIAGLLDRHIPFLLVELSCLYNFRRSSDKADVEKAWVPPSLFVRSTKKYLVRVDDIVKLKLEIIKHLPILVFGKSQLPSVNSIDELVVPDDTWITSVYWDNDKHELYDRKIHLSEGAELLRLRWYGIQSDKIFVERKTHHESWVLEDSKKERFSLKNDQISKYLSGEIIIPDFDATRKELDEVFYLQMSIQRRIRKNNLKPLVRTVYKRTAFQFSKDNDVRISLDTKFYFGKEPPYHGLENICGNTFVSQKSGFSTTPFPYAILEVKLRNPDQPPIWVDNLINSGLVAEAERFSKFLHSSARLYGEKVKVLPHWFSQSNLVDYPYNELGWHLFFTADSKMFNNSVSMTMASNKGVAKRSTNFSISKHSALFSGDSFQHGRVTTSAVPISRTRDGQQVASSVSPSQHVMISSSESESDNDDFCSVEFPPQVQGSESNIPLKPILRPVKVEPKTFFANERTLLQWLNMTLFIALGAVALLAVESVSSIVVFSIFGLAIAISIYALTLFHWRRRALRYHNARGNYDDAYGPSVVVTLFVAFLILGAWTESNNRNNDLAVGYTTDSSLLRHYSMPLHPDDCCSAAFSPTADQAAAAISRDLTLAEAALTLQLWTTLKDTLFQDYTTLGRFDAVGAPSSENLAYWDTSSCLMHGSGYTVMTTTSNANIDDTTLSSVDTTTISVSYVSPDHTDVLAHTYIPREEVLLTRSSQASGENIIRVGRDTCPPDLVESLSARGDRTYALRYNPSECGKPLFDMPFGDGATSNVGSLQNIAPTFQPVFPKLLEVVTSKPNEWQEPLLPVSSSSSADWTHRSSAPITVELAPRTNAPLGQLTLHYYYSASDDLSNNKLKPRRVELWWDILLPSERTSDFLTTLPYAVLSPQDLDALVKAQNLWNGLTALPRFSDGVVRPMDFDTYVYAESSRC